MNSKQNHSDTRQDFICVATISTWVNTDCDRRQNECTQALNELIDDFGVECVIRGIMDTSAEEKVTKLGGDHLRTARSMLAEIQHSSNAGLAADLLALAIGEGVRTGKNLSDIATYWGCTKQAVSKQLIGMVERLNLPRLTCQLSLEARASYRASNRRNYGAKV